MALMARSTFTDEGIVLAVRYVVPDERDPGSPVAGIVGAGTLEIGLDAVVISGSRPARRVPWLLPARAVRVSVPRSAIRTVLVTPWRVDLHVSHPALPGTLSIAPLDPADVPLILLALGDGHTSSSAPLARLTPEQWLTARLDDQLPAVLAAHATLAAAAGHTPCLYLHARRGRTRSTLEEKLRDAEVALVLAHVRFIAVDATFAGEAQLDRLRQALALPDLGRVYPQLVELDGAGMPTGRVLAGEAWNSASPAQARRALGNFFPPSTRRPAASSGLGTETRRTLARA